jgi:hydrogenase maturation protein HypF
VARRAGELDEKVVAARIRLTGHVQGVGFRPFVFRLAGQHGVQGHVQNQQGEVEIVAVAPAAVMERFVHELIDNAPPLSRPRISARENIDLPDVSGFEIAASSSSASAHVFVPPDYFMCDDCYRELYEPSDRRFHYPFINCTQCGPRYTLIRSLPYDRPNTSMAQFELCPQCEAEYCDPGNRRFHAEPVACPACGPSLRYQVAGERDIRETGDALDAAVAAVTDGRIVAVKGIGGYHLLCDAENEAAVAMLRQRKRRPDKPLAVMFPRQGPDGLDAVRQHVSLSASESDLLTSPVRPIVLAARQSSTGLAANIAPGLREVGVFLPYSPLHQLLLDRIGGPVVATSGNVSGEPVLTDNADATERLSNIADGFLQHDRPIVRPADDPVYRQIGGAMRPIRIGRGSAPREIDLPWSLPQPLLAVGGHMKGTVALAWDRRVVVSPHIGEMDSPRSLAVFEQLGADLQALYGVTAERIACDAHPGYTTGRWARQQSVLPVDEVWHHAAHASAVAGEYPRSGRWLVFAWDGVGLGEDGTLWGGEALHGRAGQWRRVASLRPFRLPGGDRAGREPWRSAAALHWECGMSFDSGGHDDGLARTAWQQRLNTPETSAAGRLFDAAAAMVCGLQRVSFEAQGPMQLESLCSRPGAVIDLPLSEDNSGLLRSDWQPLLGMLGDRSRDKIARAESFHTSMATALRRQAVAVRDRQGVDQVGLCGGVFQNRVLTEQVMTMLEADGFTVHVPELLPCNDAAISFGQAAHVAARPVEI